MNKNLVIKCNFMTLVWVSPCYIVTLSLIFSKSFLNSYVKYIIFWAFSNILQVSYIYPWILCIVSHLKFFNFITWCSVFNKPLGSNFSYFILIQNLSISLKFLIFFASCFLWIKNILITSGVKYDQFGGSCIWTAHSSLP